ncbi:hypothetical protein HanRHA438_Chr05g0227891 [Helianthus annuus]|uniref:Uncharacterized protein n=1 Tax=Helianthus annuus TaxID=4232 RepID=A0A9K3J0E9_HELAN|nr:hypothetical protein HanXRQr2_Chr05g0218791 [Helianthus annuus]KAJ0570519.1 hypothetical protein HanHA300_Chr05g0178931 [Helianthus annuus]KAJ0577370.1 hypothetical protein HanIR_Chr05g0235201 [Helianthus annuus]KAJ0584866.1 hypothetical protein HanHA89_Chr05g0193671 [Helianthus annuus]KAJ0747437.1 hypothetical protein HanOQP8_Chr05g0189431 [Helianthus annuus]
MEVAAIMAIALANGRVTNLKFSTVFKYATVVKHLIGSFRTSGIGVALSGPDGGWPPNCCVTCSGQTPHSFTKEEIEYLIKRIQDGGNKAVKERQITFL